MMWSRRSSSFFDFSPSLAWSMARSKSVWYHASENWYIGSMLAIAAIEKKRIDERKATDL